MTVSAYLLVSVALALAIYLMFSSARRPRLSNRLAKLVPGAGLVSTVHGEKSTRVRKLSKPKTSQIDFELPDIVELLASAVLAGNSLHSAITRVCSRADGLVAFELSMLLKKLELGSHFDQELSALCQRLPHAGIREFANKLSLALARGTPLAASLVALSQALRKKQAATILARAGANETKMLIPLVALVLPTTVIFATYPSIQFLSFGFN